MTTMKPQAKTQIPTFEVNFSSRISKKTTLLRDWHGVVGLITVALCDQNYSSDRTR